MNRKPQGLVVQNPSVCFSAETLEEGADYVNAAVRTVDQPEASPAPKVRGLPALAACWLSLLLIMALRIYFTSVMSDNNMRLTAENLQLKEQNQNLTAENLQLKEQNQDLETEKKNLTEQILNMETKWTELNVTRAQWSIDNYCPKGNNGRQCRPCQEGWDQSQSSCFAINNPGRPDLKTWEEAREHCRGKVSDLAVAVNEAERTFIISKSWNSEGITGYWIGLRVEGGQWKWINGSDLINSSWVDAPTNGNCAVSDDKQQQKWKSANCSEKLRWICGKKAITV
ncbi:asialoglycoprotein receptor 1-like [Mastacembelus armatus]|uniref:asialoglycoprotein receptor 1-like n=1 Tax=Mastacembelus armatus TaxID=205130 RepID=UPI000E45E4E3|nr:asialoglycoprotein receptor 1-like [Mastacembelus armatus]